MLYLALSVLFSSLIFVIFKLFTKFNIQTLYAIIVNYFVASIVGILFPQGDISLLEIPQKDWFWGTMLLGVLFIAVFNIMAATSQKLGVSVASVATKMSLVIPVIFGVLLYNEVLSYLEIVGILLALVAVYLASVKKSSIKAEKWTLVLPILVFLGSGCIDTSINYFQEVYVAEKEYAIFSATVFASAGINGVIYILLNFKKQPLKINTRNILGGISLGVPNYFSIYFLLKALKHPTLTSASVFTINNVAIVMFSTLLGIVLFKEVLTPKNWLGVGLAIISIILVAFGDDLIMFLQ